MPHQGNTSDSTRNEAEAEILVEDGILPRFGVVTFVAIDSDEYRSCRGASTRVYVILCLFADKRMGCYPRQTTIAHMAGLARETVARAIGELCAVGLVEKGWRDKRVTYKLVRPPSRRREL